MSLPPTAHAMYLSNPAPVQTVTSTGYTLHMELDAFTNYGAADGAADILYSSVVAPDDGLDWHRLDRAARRDALNPR
jgi:hypothetical protein